MEEHISMILLHGRVQIVKGDNELERAGASVVNGFIAIAQGLSEAGEAGVDGVCCLTTWLASQVPVNDLEAREFMQKNTMSFVSTEYVKDTYSYFYNSTDIGIELDEKAYDPLKSTGVGYQLATGVAYEGTMAIVTTATGGGAVGYAAIAGIAGYGRNTEEYWANAKANAEGDEWQTAKIYDEGNAYGLANGGWEAASHFVGGEMLIAQTPIIAENAVATAATRVFIDAGMNALDTPVKAGIDTVITGVDFETAFEERGGWAQMATDAATGAIVSGVAEKINWDKTKVAAETAQDVNYLKKEGLLDDIDKKETKKLTEALNRRKLNGEDIDASKLEKSDIQYLIKEEELIEQLNKNKSKSTGDQNRSKQTKQAEVEEPTRSKEIELDEQSRSKQTKQIEVEEPESMSQVDEINRRKTANTGNVNENIKNKETVETRKIDDIIEKAKEQEVVAGGNNKECYLIDDYALLRQTIPSEEVGDLAEIIKITDELEKNGVHVAKTIDYKITGQKIEDYGDFTIHNTEVDILQQRAKGNPLLDGDHIDWSNNDYQIKYLEQLESIANEELDFYKAYISDWMEIEKSGMQIDSSKAGNFMYEPGKNITFIDLDLGNRTVDIKNQILEQQSILLDSSIYYSCTPEIRQKAMEQIQIIDRKYREAAIDLGIDRRILDESKSKASIKIEEINNSVPKNTKIVSYDNEYSLSTSRGHKLGAVYIQGDLIIDSIEDIPPKYIDEIKSDTKVKQHTLEVISGKPGDTLVTEEEISKIFGDNQEIYFGHGTTIGEEKIIDSIFEDGLFVKKPKEISTYGNTLRGLESTTIVFGKGNEELFTQYKETLDSWPHLSAKDVVIISLPEEYMLPAQPGNDATFQMFYAGSEKDGYYLRPEFIQGTYNAETHTFTQNENFYKNLSEEQQSEIFREIKENYMDIYARDYKIPPREASFEMPFDDTEMDRAEYEWYRQQYMRLQQESYEKAKKNEEKPKSIDYNIIMTYESDGIFGDSSNYDRNDF